MRGFAFQVKRALLVRSWTLKRLAQSLGLARNTVSVAVHRAGMFPQVEARVAEALGLPLPPPASPAMPLAAHLDIACAAQDRREVRVFQSQQSTSLSPPPQGSASALGPGYVWPVSLLLAAKRLGCTAGHLRLVLTGERKSPRLLAGYEQLKAELSTAR